MTTGPVVGSTYLWAPVFYKDGKIYDVSSATVTVSFLPPTGSGAQSFSMSVSPNGASGLATYTNTTSLFTVAGQWTRSYKVVLSGVTLESPPISFQVYPSTSGS